VRNRGAPSAFFQKPKALGMGRLMSASLPDVRLPQKRTLVERVVMSFVPEADIRALFDYFIGA
jgi:hypothetical protein